MIAQPNRPAVVTSDENPRTEEILGIRFFNGSATEAVEALCRTGGYVVVPAAPALVNIQHDPGYRRALTESDLAIADSGFMVLLWRLFHRRQITRVSGLIYLKRLLERPDVQASGATFLILPSEAARDKAIPWLATQGFRISVDDCYIAPYYRGSVEDESLIEMLNARHPAHIIVGIGGGTQEKLGLYLRERLNYRPAIHCIGAALGFLTGDQKPIPIWADTLYLGWFLRLMRQPRVFGPRYAAAIKLPALIARYGKNLPPLLTR